MLFSKSLMIPANTTALSPLTEVMQLVEGTITRVYVGFPSGCCGLAHVTIFNKLHQLWPTSPDDNFSWDGYVFEWTEDYGLTEKPYQLIVKGWNEDLRFSHTIQIHIAELTGKQGWTDYLARAFGGSL